MSRRLLRTQCWPRSLAPGPLASRSPLSFLPCQGFWGKISSILPLLWKEAMIEVQPQCEVGRVGGITPWKRPENWGSGMQSCFAGVKSLAALAFWGKPRQVGTPDAAAAAELAGSPPPPCQAVLGEGSARRRNLLGQGCWSITSPFSLRGDPSRRTAIPTYWGFIGWLGWVFWGFLFCFCTWPMPDSGAPRGQFHFWAPMH